VPKKHYTRRIPSERKLFNKNQCQINELNCLRIDKCNVLPKTR
jgi:hypothetical protein